MIDDRRIDELADLFEATWKSGKRISADTFLSNADIIGVKETTYLQEILKELRLVELELERKYPATITYIAPGEPIKRLGNYEFLECIGRGGMGELYRARHVLLDKIVAVKILPEAIAENPTAIKRFERELKLIGNLSHPNIVHAHGAEQIDGKLLLVMEYIDGENLQQVIAGGKRKSIGDALAVVRQVAAGLQYAHEQKIIHRDIKPSNIMLTKDGVAKILDFGLGKFYDEFFLADQEDESGPITNLGSPLGTLDYLSPEQWDDPSGVDIRADIYGLGCTFYTLIVGEVPYPSSKFRSIREKMVAHVSRSLPSFESSGLIIDPIVEILIQKMCAKDREQRFTTPQEVLDAIDKYQRERVLAVQTKQHRSGWWKIAGAVVACVCLLGLIFMLPSERQNGETQNGKGHETTITEIDVPLPSPVALVPVQEILVARYGGDLNKAQRLCRDWLEEAEKEIQTSVLQSQIAVAYELFADCTLYGMNSSDRQYEYFVRDAEEFYLQAISLTESAEKRSILNSKRAVLLMLSGDLPTGLKTLEAGMESVVARADDGAEKSTLFFEVSNEIGDFYRAATLAQRQQSLRQVLNRISLNSPSSAFLLDDLRERERFDLQLLCIRLLLSAGLESDDLSTVQQDVAAHLDRILLGVMETRRDLRPYLRKDFELAIRCYPNDLLKQADYIYKMRMDTSHTGSARLIFYFDHQEGFAIFLPVNLSGGKKFPLWTREELRNKLANRLPLVLDEQLVALVQAEWDADRRVSLSWSDEICFPPRSKGLSYADWPFDAQLDLRRFVGTEK